MLYSKDCCEDSIMPVKYLAYSKCSVIAIKSNITPTFRYLNFSGQLLHLQAVPLRLAINWSLLHVQLLLYANELQGPWRVGTMFPFPAGSTPPLPAQHVVTILLNDREFFLIKILWSVSNIFCVLISACWQKAVKSPCAWKVECEVALSKCPLDLCWGNP